MSENKTNEPVVKQVSKWTMRVLNVDTRTQSFMVRIEGSDRAKVWHITRLQTWDTKHNLWREHLPAEQAEAVALLKKSYPEREFHFTIQP